MCARRAASSWAMVIALGLTCFPGGSVEDSYLAQGPAGTTGIFAPLGFGDRWECVAALPGGIIAKETIVGFLDTVLEMAVHQKLLRQYQRGYRDDFLCTGGLR